jgi:hypothetical protein
LPRTCKANTCRKNKALQFNQEQTGRFATIPICNLKIKNVMDISEELKVNLIADVENVLNKKLSFETKTMLMRCFEITLVNNICNPDSIELIELAKQHLIRYGHNGFALTVMPALMAEFAIMFHNSEMNNIKS